MNMPSSSSNREVQGELILGLPHPCFVILENLSECIFTVDLRKKINSFNHAAENVTGFKRQEAIGQHCFDIFRSNICESRCVMDQSISDGVPQQDRPAFIINKAGDQIPISLSTSFLRDREEHIIGLFGIFRDLSELENLRRQITRTFTHEDIIGKVPRIREILAFLPDIAESESAVLIEGPTGSGKELFARAIHHLSSRQKGPFIAINCGALPDSLLESEIFGYKRGAFTGAVRNKPGRFLLADKGTLFLDEICNTSVTFQKDLLRVLEEGEFTALGDTKTQKTDCRVVASTNRDLKVMIKEGTFREDLYYRLNVVKISLPPLKQRRGDIPLLVEHFIYKYNLLKGRVIHGVTHEVISHLMDYPFPGNIRELENIIEYAYILCKDDYIAIEHLPRDVRDWVKTNSHSFSASGTLAREEGEKIGLILSKHGGNRLATARELGISRSTLWRKITKYGLS
jgi:PAS domain S-box-containing protein